jgi:MFS family permease
MFTSKKRTVFGILRGVIWVLGLSLLSPLAFVISGWRELRLTIFIFIGVLGLLSLILVQESIRWLISVSRVKKVFKVIDRVARFNRISNNQKGNNSYKKRKKKLRKILKELGFSEKNQKNQKTNYIGNN